MRAKLRLLSATGLSCGLGLFLAACGDQAGSSSVLGTFSDAVPLQARIASDTSLKPEGDSLQATVSQKNGVGVRRHATVPFAAGTAISLDTVIQGKLFTVSANGFQVSGGKRVNRWWASGSDSARTADSLQTILLALTKGPVLDSLPKLDSFKVGVKIPARKAPTLWYTLDSSDPRVSKTAHFDSAGVLVTSGQLWKIALKSDSVAATGQPALWSDTTHWIFRANTPVPSFSLKAGTYFRAQFLTLTDSLSPASILWSLDSLTWAVFKDSIALDSHKTIYAKAASAGKDTSRVVSASFLFKVTTPVLDTGSHSYTRAQTIRFSDSTTASALHCRIDTLPWGECKDSIVVDSSRKLLLYASRPGWANSDTVSASYHFTVPTPAISLDSGRYTSVRSALLSDSLTGVTFHCSANDTLWTDCKDSVVIDASRKFFVYASRAGWANSAVAFRNYTFSLPAPSLSLPSGTYTSVRSALLSDSLTAVAFHCSSDTANSANWADCKDSVVIDSSRKLFVYASRIGWNNSPIVLANYTLSLPAPSLSLASGSYAADTSVSASDSVAGATFQYTTDTTLATSWAALTTLPVTHPTTLYVRATKVGWNTSPVVSASYVFSDTLTTLHSLTIDSGVLTPAFDSLQASYLDSVPSSLNVLTITPTASSHNATLLINGAAIMTHSSTTVNVSKDTAITILVRNPRSGTTRSYTLSVIHRAPQLSGLTLSEGILSPAFSPSVHAYVDSVNPSATNLTVTVKASDALWIDGAKATSGVPFSLTAPSSAAVSYVILDSNTLIQKAVRCTLTLAPTAWNTSASIAYGTVSWRGRNYRTTTIGNQTWMAENLNLRSLNGTDTLGSCYDDLPANCDTYGRYYTWAEAMNGALARDTAPSGVRGLCPEGWHLPSKAEWDTLFTHTIAGYPTVAASWNLPLRATASLWNGTDAFGFRGLPAGGKYPNSADSGTETHFWTTNSDATGKAWTANFKDDVSPFENLDRGFAYPVRCLKDY